MMFTILEVFVDYPNPIFVTHALFTRSVRMVYMGWGGDVIIEGLIVMAT